MSCLRYKIYTDKVSEFRVVELIDRVERLSKLVEGNSDELLIVHLASSCPGFQGYRVMNMEKQSFRMLKIVSS